MRPDFIDSAYVRGVRLEKLDFLSSKPVMQNVMKSYLNQVLRHAYKNVISSSILIGFLQRINRVDVDDEIKWQINKHKQVLNSSKSLRKNQLPIDVICLMINID